MDYKQVIHQLEAGMVPVPGGTFLMGSEKGTEIERPVHQVMLTSFEIGRYLVTQDQYQAIMGERPIDLTGTNICADGDCPVQSVNWKKAIEFCKILSDETGRKYSLPTEAQWEYACRAGSKTEFCFGDNESLLGDYCWYAGNYSDDRMHPVGQKKPNAWGLYDMHGFVYELCLDCWHDNYEGAPVDGSAWESETERFMRVIRGGHWRMIPYYCRSAFRHFCHSGDIGGGDGLRLVVNPVKG